MMKADDKELVLPPDDEPEKVPKIEVYTSKVIQASKKPWFAGCLGLVLASFAVLLSLILLATVLAYIGYLPQQVRIKNRSQFQGIQYIQHPRNYFFRSKTFSSQLTLLVKCLIPTKTFVSNVWMLAAVPIQSQDGILTPIKPNVCNLSIVDVREISTISRRNMIAMPNVSLGAMII